MKPKTSCMAWTLGACSALGLLSGCKSPATETRPSASVATPQASAAAPPSAKEKPWFSGAFSGHYAAERQEVDVKVGGVREWRKDDGKLASGPGSLSLRIDDDGLVDGTTEGPLGASHVSGKVEEDTLRVQLSPDTATGLHGVLIAKRAGTGFKGSLEASTGDSLQVRRATVELDKKAD